MEPPKIEPPETPVNPGADDGKCAGTDCNTTGLTEEHRCAGCGYTICTECDVNSPTGSHFVIDHWEDDGLPF